MTDPRLLLPDTRLEEIERDAAHSRRLGLTVTFAVVSEQLAFVQELRRLRDELAEARRALAELGARELRPSGYSTSRSPERPSRPVADRDPHPHPEPPYESRREAPLEVEVTIVQRDVTGRELSRVRQRMPLDDVPYRRE
jgi:hypothetical protein